MSSNLAPGRTNPRKHLALAASWIRAAERISHYPGSIAPTHPAQLRPTSLGADLEIRTKEPGDAGTVQARVSSAQTKPR